MLEHYGTAYWPIFIPQVQWIANSTFHYGVNSTPYELVHGQPPTMGLSGLNLTSEVMQRLYAAQCETDLIQVRRKLLFIITAVHHTSMCDANR